MSDTISATGQSFWHLLRDYLFAVAKYWYAIVVGLVLSWVDFAERSLGTWWIFRPWVRLVTVTVAFAAAQFLAYRDLHLAHLTAKEEDTRKHLAETTGLKQEVEALKSRRGQYDEKHLQLAKSKLMKLSPASKSLVLYLLHYGRTEQEALVKKCQPPEQFYEAIQQASREGLVKDSHTGNTARPGTLYFWEINPAFEVVLKELLGNIGEQ